MIAASTLPSYELYRQFQADESYIIERRKGIHGRNATGKIVLIELFKSGRKVYTIIITNDKTEKLLPFN